MQVTHDSSYNPSGIPTLTNVYRILIADRLPIIRHGLRQLLEQEPGIDVCGDAEPGEDAIQQARILKPDFVLTDLHRTGLRGMEYVRELSQAQEEAAIVIYSEVDNPLYVKQVLQRGVRGYILKSEGLREVLDAVSFVRREGVWVSAKLRASLLRNALPSHRRIASESPELRLSRREFEVFLLIGGGYAPRHIAESLNLSVKTIESHRDRIKQKMELPTAAALRKYAVEWVQHEIGRERS